MPLQHSQPNGGEPMQLQANAPFRVADMLARQSAQTQERMEEAQAARDFLDRLVKDFQQQLDFITTHMKAIAVGQLPDLSVEIGVESSPRPPQGLGTPRTSYA